MTGEVLALEVWWPELFEGLDPEQRRGIVNGWAGCWHEGWIPNREDVADLNELVRGEITDEEYERRALAKATRRSGGSGTGCADGAGL